MENEIDIDLRDIYQIIKKRIGLIVIITLTTTFLASIISVFFISPIYESKVGIIISKETGEKITSSDVSMYQSLMQTYRDVASTNKVAQMTAEKLGEGIKASDLKKNVTVTAKTGTMILNITYKSNVAVNSFKGAEAYAESFVERAKELLPEGNVTIMDNAELPKSPVKPNVFLNILIAFFLGLMISVGLSFLLEYLNNTIVSKEDVEKYLELSVIGIIPNYEDK